MTGLPPICQSPAGKGGESNGAGGMRRGFGALGSGGVYAGVPNCSRNASPRRCTNGSRSFFSARAAFACSSLLWAFACCCLGLAPVFSRARRVGFAVALSLSANVFSRSSNAFSRASSSAFRCASCFSAVKSDASCACIVAVISSTDTIVVRHFLVFNFLSLFFALKPFSPKRKRFASAVYTCLAGQSGFGRNHVHMRSWLSPGHYSDLARRLFWRQHD